MKVRMIMALAVLFMGAAALGEAVYVDIPGQPPVYCDNAQVIPLENGAVKVVMPWATYVTGWARVVVIDRKVSTQKKSK